MQGASLRPQAEIRVKRETHESFICIKLPQGCAEQWGEAVGGAGGGGRAGRAKKEEARAGTGWQQVKGLVWTECFLCSGHYPDPLHGFAHPPHDSPLNWVFYYETILQMSKLVRLNSSCMSENSTVERWITASTQSA